MGVLEVLGVSGGYREIFEAFQEVSKHFWRVSEAFEGVFGGFGMSQERYMGFMWVLGDYGGISGSFRDFSETHNFLKRP